MHAESRYADIAFAFVEACDRLHDVGSVLREFKSAVEQLGFTHFIITGLPLPHQPLEPLVILNAWPSGWYRRYTEKGYFHSDPVGQHALETNEPFRWSDVPERLRSTPGAETVMGEAQEFGLTDGYCVPICTLTGWQSAVALARDKPLEGDRKELAAVHLMAIYAHGRVRRLLGEQVGERARLTPREREVLTWAAAGKTAWETGRILNISETTVISHLDHIRRKLNVANTTQAVAAALRTGELQPY